VVTLYVEELKATMRCRFAWLGLSVILLAVGILATVGTQDTWLDGYGIIAYGLVPLGFIPIAAGMSAIYEMGLAASILPMLFYPRCPGALETDTMSAMTEYAVEMDGITRRFGDLVAVDHVTLKIPRGHLYGFLGLNGAGKPTTIRVLTRLLPPTVGNAKL
jgi:hypothetical protein